MRCCYHIQSHRSPDQVLRLVETIKRSSPDSVVHVSHDAFGASLDVSAIEAHHDTVVQFQPGGYGDYRHLERYFGAVRWIEDEGIDVDWFVNISGQDHPIVPLQHAEHELRTSGVDGFMEHWDPFGPDSSWPPGRATNRYHFRHERVAQLSPDAQRRLRPVQAINRIQPFVRCNVAYGLTVGHRVRRLPFGNDVRLWCGSAFSSLSWPVVSYVHERLRADPALVDHFRHTLVPDEAVIQTVACSAGQFEFDTDCKRFFDFSATKMSHPKVLTADDLPRAFASGAHFARKFDHDRDPELLDAVDRHVAELRRAEGPAGSDGAGPERLSSTGSELRIAETELNDPMSHRSEET